MNENGRTLGKKKHNLRKTAVTKVVSWKKKI